MVTVTYCTLIFQQLIFSSFLVYMVAPFILHFHHICEFRYAFTVHFCHTTIKQQLFYQKTSKPPKYNAIPSASIETIVLPFDKVDAIMTAFNNYYHYFQFISELEICNTIPFLDRAADCRRIGNKSLYHRADFSITTRDMPMYKCT